MGHQKWINFYRLSDYIAGKVAVSGVDNRIILSNYKLGHLCYFKEDDILEVATTRLSALATNALGRKT